MEDWISQRAFARRRGVSHTAVQKAIRDRRIPEASIRRKGDRIEAIEYQSATAAWDANTDPAAVAKNTLGSNEPTSPAPDESIRSVTSADAGADAASPAAADSSELEPELPSGLKDPHGYQAERTKREKFAALTAELDYLKAIGRVVDLEEINEAQRSLFRNVRDKFLNLADRLTPVVTTERDPARVHAAIKAEIEQVLNELSHDASAEAAEGTAERLAA